VFEDMVLGRILRAKGYGVRASGDKCVMKIVICTIHQILLGGLYPE
jgi:hypothetical protein